MQTRNDLRIDIRAARRWLPAWGTLLSGGVALQVTTGESVKALLCDQLGVPTDYLEQRIQTVFLNGQAVDDVNAAIVGDGDVLAISAAMPGLVGAVMRRGGRYASLRNSITHHAGGQTAARTRGTLHLKLFNLVARELGPQFLKQGVLLAATTLAAFLEAQPADFHEGIREVRFDDRPVAVPVLAAIASQADAVLLTVAEA